MALTFQAFEVAHKAIIDQYFKAYKFSNSEFTFTNVIMWGQDGKIKWAEQDDILFILLQFGSHPIFMFPPMPKRNIDEAFPKGMDIAIEYFSEQGYVPRFRSVNGMFVPLFEKHCPQFTLAADRDTFDYVYLAQDLITLSGRKYHSKRNHIHQFTSQYAHTYRPLTSDMAEECMDLYMSWLQEKDIYEPGILGEMKAVRFLLPNMEQLGLSGGGIWVNDKLVAFSLGEKISDDIAVIHIEKADANYAGLYAVINQQFAEHTWQDVTYINREEDMGIPGMRKAKLSYKPAFLIEKYNAIWRP